MLFIHRYQYLPSFRWQRVVSCSDNKAIFALDVGVEIPRHGDDAGNVVDGEFLGVISGSDVITETRIDAFVGVHSRDGQDVRARRLVLFDRRLVAVADKLRLIRRELK